MKNGMILWAVSGVAAVGLAVACSSSSGGSSSPPPDGGSPEDTGSTVIDSGSSSGSSSGGADTGVTCTSASMCPTGQICCGSISMLTNCQTGACPSTPIGALQLCASSAECLTAGDTCGPIAAAPTLPVMICNPGTAPTGDSGSDAAPVSTDAGGDAAADGG
jgi:hypothetical protein